MREGFEPSRINPASGSGFAIGDDEDDPGDVGDMHEDPEEAQPWDESSSRSQEGGSSANSHKYGSLDDRHVWEAKDRDEA